MIAKVWHWKEPLKILSSKDDPYLKTATGTLGAHELGVHCSTAPEAPLDFRIFLDQKLIFEPGMVTPEVSWYQLCRELGYHAEDHWDLDPALILFHQALPVLIRGWREQTLPLNDLGIPDGVVCLATVQDAWNRAVKALLKEPDEDPDAQGAIQVGASFNALPLRAVVFHDDPGRREDYVGTAVDDPLLGIFIHLGRSRKQSVSLAKAAITATGGLRWSPWEAGGAWDAEGRTFKATQGPEDFRKAAALEGAMPKGFEALFWTAAEGLVKILDPVVEDYRHAYPAGITWHRDPLNRFLDRTIVEARTESGQQVLVLDDGTQVVVAEIKQDALTQVVGKEDET